MTENKPEPKVEEKVSNTETEAEPKAEVSEAEPKEEKPQEKKDENRVIRILSQDIEGRMTLYSGLTKIKGVSWTMSNAICKKLGLDKKRKIGSLSDAEMQNLMAFIKNPDVPEYLVNRRNDFETGKAGHLIGSDLDLKKEFDIKRLKKIKSYKGYRHMSGLPVRGQRTRSNFRRNKAKGAGIKKKVKK